MTAAYKDVFADMKNEDSKFGERSGKAFTAKDHLKRQKHRVDFKNLKPTDFAKMSDNYDIDEDEMMENQELEDSQ